MTIEERAEYVMEKVAASDDPGLAFMEALMDVLAPEPKCEFDGT